MAEYCLITSVDEGLGSIQQPGCSYAWKAPGESCATNYTEGVFIELKAQPDSGWEVDDWDSTVDGVFTTPTAGQDVVTILMPSQDVDVTVSFKHPDVNLILEVGSGNGCIELSSPTGYTVNCAGGSILLVATQVRVSATPSDEWEIDSWELDGVDLGTTAAYVDFTLIGYSSRRIVVNFTPTGPCTTNDLVVNIVGKGSVSPPSGEYCDYFILNLNPIPANGYYFKEWQYDLDSGISEHGVLLTVNMSIDRAVTVVFEPIPAYETANVSLFYCPSETYQDNIVSFGCSNSSSSTLFHFRANFYSDSSKNDLIYSASSLLDNKRWFYDNGSFVQIPPSGVTIDTGTTMNIVYDPEILPHQFTEIQKTHRINNSDIFETPLICGNQYYIDVEIYDVVEQNLNFLETISLILDCEDVDLYSWSYNKDANNWLSSGQGKADLKVTDSSDQSVFSDVSSNIFGIFQIIWQSRRNSVGGIYGSMWDSSQDLLYSSGQGMYDKLYIKDNSSVNNPIVITDQSNNFYIAGSVIDRILYNACPLPISLEGVVTTDSPTASFESLCNPGLITYLDSSYDTIKVRVYEEDVDKSLVINDDKVVPVVVKQSIRLDIDGIQGAYAIRLRNINDQNWGGWINIDNNLYYNPNTPTDVTDDITDEDILYDAYRIDNSRFIVPWKIDKVNGIRRICCQVLTMYGITNTFCLEIFVNFDIVQHVFRFYYSIGSERYEFPMYNGQYVLSLKRDSDNTIISTIEFEVIFSEPIYYNESVTPHIPYSDTNPIKFNVVQQGINDKWGETLINSGDHKTFTGSFTISEEDGVFNKDGTAFVDLIFPDSLRQEGCLPDSSDLYNLMVSDSEIATNKDLTPEEIYEKYKTSRISKVLNIDGFKQYYDQDDNNFKFGNPLYFKNL